MNTRVKFGVLGVLFLVVLGLVINGQQMSENETVACCDLIANAEKYNGKTVSVNATYRYGFETQEIYCIGCREVGKTWLEIGFDLPVSSKKLIKKFPKDNGTINAVFSGKFESSDGPFGDGGYRFRLVLHEIAESKIVTKSGAVPGQLPVQVRKVVCGGASDASENPVTSTCYLK